jgi:hypothetical protein
MPHWRFMAKRSMPSPALPGSRKSHSEQMGAEMDVQQGLPQPYLLGKPSIFGLFKPKFWWRRRDSNLRHRAYEFWGLTFAEIPRRPYLVRTSEKSTHPTLGDQARTAADSLKWVHKGVH